MINQKAMNNWMYKYREQILSNAIFRNTKPPINTIRNVERDIWKIMRPHS